MNKLLYLIKTSFENIYHHRKIAVTLVLTLIILISVNYFVLLLGNNLQLGMQIFNEKLRMELILNKDITNNEIDKLIKKIQGSSTINIEEIVVNDATQNLKKFANSSKTIKKIIPLLKENPLPSTVILHLKFNDKTIKNIDKFISKIKKDKVEEIIYPKEWFEKGHKIKQIIEYSIYIINFLVIFISYIFWINIFKVSLYQVEKEIEIMEVVGGTKTYIRTPFLIENIIYSLISFVLSIGILKYMHHGIEKYFRKIIFISHNQILIGLVLTLLVTLIATERAINKFFTK